MTGNRLPEKWQWLGLLGNRLVKSSNRLVNEKRQSIGKKVQSLGWLFWPNESKSSHVIIGNTVFIIYAEIAGITKYVKDSIIVHLPLNIGIWGFKDIKL